MTAHIEGMNMDEKYERHQTSPGISGIAHRHGERERGRERERERARESERERFVITWRLPKMRVPTVLIHFNFGFSKHPAVKGYSH